MIEFYLFRHGETDWNLMGRLQGSADIPLNAHGMAQAEGLRAFFDLVQADPHFNSKEKLLSSIVSSPLLRARETVRIALRLPETDAELIRTDKRFAETHLGQAEGMTRDELIGNFGEESWNHWISLGPDSWHAKFPDGETKGEVRDRAMQALDDLVREAEAHADHVRTRIWFVATHGGLLRRLLHHFHPGEIMPIDVVNGAVFKFVFHGHTRSSGRWHVEKSPIFLPR